jgi:hypothetical protein
MNELGGLIYDFLTSKKWLTAVAACVVAAAAKIGLELPTEEIAVILSPIIAYILGQGWADTGTGVEKIRLRGLK